MSVLIAALLVLSISVPALAVSPAEDQPQNCVVTITNEYEAYRELAACSDEELSKAGLSKDEIEEIRTTNFESALLARASLPEDQLHNMGYTPEQIALLKAYDGAPLTPDSAVLAATSSCTGRISLYENCSTSKLSFKYTWNWNTPPVFSKTDAVGVVWEGYNLSSIAVSTKVYTKGGVAQYYSTLTGKRMIAYDETLSITGHNGLSGYKAEFPMGKTVYPVQSDGTNAVYAKSGYIYFGITGENAVELSHMIAFAAYGHAHLIAITGISIGADGLSLSFTPSGKVDTLAPARARIYSNGSITEDPY